MHINFKLLCMIKEKRITQKKLSELSGINQNFISMIVRGRYNPDEEQKSKIAKALKVSVKEVF